MVVAAHNIWWRRMNNRLSLLIWITAHLNFMA